MDNKYDPDWQGVQIDDSNSRCTQVRAKNGQVLCFENEIVNEQNTTIVSKERISFEFVKQGISIVLKY